MEDLKTLLAYFKEHKKGIIVILIATVIRLPTSSPKVSSSEAVSPILPRRDCWFCRIGATHE